LHNYSQHLLIQLVESTKSTATIYALKIIKRFTHWLLCTRVAYSNATSWKSSDKNLG